MRASTPAHHGQGDKYTDRWKYSESQAEKKKGFLTSDFSKRDEFSNTCRTGQYREQLKVRWQGGWRGRVRRRVQRVGRPAAGEAAARLAPPPCTAG